MTAVLLSLAGGFGALARVELGLLIRRLGHPLWATRMVNIVGTAAMAFLVTSETSHELRQIVGIGLLGGFTTFSTWMCEVDAQSGRQRAEELVIPLVVSMVLAAIILAIR